MMAPIKLSVFYPYIYLYVNVCWENFKTNKQRKQSADFVVINEHKSVERGFT